jgi:hypothetical protein
MNNQESTSYAVIGQKYAYATASLILGIACYVNLAGLEKAILAITFAWLALRSDPGPQLSERRRWAKIGASMGLFVLILIPTLILFNLDRLEIIIDALQKLSEAK